MPRKMKSLSKPQMEVIDAIALITLSAEIENKIPDMAGFKDFMRSQMTPKQNHICIKLQQRIKQISAEYCEHYKREQLNAG